MISKAIARWTLAAMFMLTTAAAGVACDTKANAQTAHPTPTKVVMTAHPEKQNKPVAVPNVDKPMPAPKAERTPKAPSETVVWIPGDYLWNGGDWAWSDGYWNERPWDGVAWTAGHWTHRWWGWAWVPGYWS